MKHCKLIVTDLDGTLLRNDKSISKFTLETLERCRRQGILIAFATARPVRGVTAMRSSFEPDILINHNGAVFAYGDDQISLGISREQLNVILTNILAAYPQAEIGVESNDVFYANYDVTKHWWGEPHIRTEASFDEFDLAYADKIVISLEDEDVNALEAYLVDDCYLEVAEDILGMVMSKRATKFNAITAICDVLEIKPADVVCFGDDRNDISMLQGCGIGVAMENANEVVKEVADVLCASNEQDGVATWIREFIL